MPPKAASGGAGGSTSPTLNRTLSSFFQKDTSKSNESSKEKSEKNANDSKQENPSLESSPSVDSLMEEDGKENIVNTPTKRSRKSHTTSSTPSSPAKAKRASAKAKNGSKSTESKIDEENGEGNDGQDGSNRTFLLSEVSIPVKKKATPRKKAASTDNEASTATTTAHSEDSIVKEQDTPRKNAKKTSKSATKTAPKNTAPSNSQDVEMAPASPATTSAKDQQQDKPDTTNGQPTTTGSSSLFVCKVNKVDTVSMYRVRNGKAAITEAKLQFLNHPSTIMGLARFHYYREELQERPEDQLKDAGARLVTDSSNGKIRVEIINIPDEHLGLVARVVEESELALVDLAEHVARVLCPMDFEGYEHYELRKAAKAAAAAENKDAGTSAQPATDQSAAANVRYSTQVSRAAILDAIQKVAHRVNYGIPACNLPISSPITPANLSIYRWETKDVDRYYSKELKSAVMARREKRMEASAALLAWFLSLDLKQQQELCPVSSFTANLAQIVGGAGSLGALGMAAKRKRTSISESMEIDEDINSLSKMAKACDSSVLTSVAEMNALLQQPSTVAAIVDPAILEAKLKEAEAKKKESELKEERRLEKERKMAERQMERDQKEAERQQKEEAKKKKEEEDRLRKEQTAQRFVGFFKQVQPPQAKKNAQQQEADNMKQSNPSLASFLDLFQPFHIKSNATLAPINRFARPLSEDFEQLVLSPTIVDPDRMEEEAVPTMSVHQARQTLQTLFPRSARTNDCNETKKTVPREYRNMTVKELIQSGVLLQDQTEDPESVFNHKNIPALKMRLLQFAENYRPAYYGTWSKRSAKVTGRRFLGKDTDILDYDFDSEAEWEEDEEGEELKSDDDEEEDDISDQEEEDDWLVPEGYLSEDEGLDQEGEEGGRKERTVKKTQGTRKPLLAQLVPVIVGPIYQETFGVSTHPALETFQIEFIGDFEMGSSPFAVDTMAMEDVTSEVA
ncbi:Chromatin assembly factor 1, subunit A [Actinomortierella wolfii]|nr:Chromatin assembly factor 1, subunit A [Actinomortierella wolfii]